jgi:hypothetical protein
VPFSLLLSRQGLARQVAEPARSGPPQQEDE